MTLRTGPSLATLALLGSAVLALHLGLLTQPTLLSRETTPSTHAPSLAGAPATPTVQVTQVRTVSLALPAATAPLQPTVAPGRLQRPVAPPAATRAEVATETTQHAAPSPTAPSEVQTLPPAVEPAAADDAPTQQVLAQAASPAPSTANAAPASPPVSPPAAGPGRPPGDLPPSDLPPSITLPYDVVGEAGGLSYRASGQLDWRLDAQGYEARMELSMLFLGSRVQTSRGSVGPEGLRPERFADRRRSERAAHFDRESGRIRFSNNAAPAELMPGAQDRLSLFMQLAGLLRARTHREGEVITFQVAGIGDAEPWHFEVGPVETLDLPSGPLQARRLARTPRKPHDSTVEVWLAPSLGHLPVRLRVAQANGDVADQRLARLP